MLHWNKTKFKKEQIHTQGMNDSRRLYVEWRQPDIKVYIYYDSKYMKFDKRNTK